MIEKYQRKVKAGHLSKLYNIPEYIFEQSTSNAFRRHENQIEEAIINEQSQLSQEELDRIEEMFKIFKTEGLK